MRILSRKVLISILGGLVTSVLLLFIINRYVFSWTGLISSQLGLCEYRSVMVPTFNGYNKKLSQWYDIQGIASVMRKNHSYEVGIHNGSGIVVSRTFDGVKYNIIFDENSGVSEFNLNTYNFRGYPDGMVTDGERCTTPSYVIESKVNRMIYDLPLSDSQRSELKQYVIATNAGRGKIF
jgi:hypothetical protein